jgi:hypothetical protein
MLLFNLQNVQQCGSVNLIQFRWCVQQHVTRFAVDLGHSPRSTDSKLTPAA